MEQLKQNPQQQPARTIPQAEFDRALGQELLQWTLDRAGLLTRVDTLTLHLQARDQEIENLKRQNLDLARERDRYREKLRRYIEAYGEHLYPAAMQQKGENEQPTTA